MSASKILRERRRRHQSQLLRLQSFFQIHLHLQLQPL